MKVFMAILMAALVLFGAAACTPTASPAPTVEATVEATVAATEPPAEAGTKDYDQIGSDLMASDAVGTVKLNMTESELLAVLGQPESESDAQVWGADGLKHADWFYQTKGLTVNMVESTNPESEFTAYSIIAVAPCDQLTLKGIKIGDTKDKVLVAYGDAVEDQSDEGTKDSIIAGTVFGGVIFGMKDGVVESIFIGASAE